MEEDNVLRALLHMFISNRKDEKRQRRSSFFAEHSSSQLKMLNVSHLPCHLKEAADSQHLLTLRNAEDTETTIAHLQSTAAEGGKELCKDKVHCLHA